MNEAIYWKQARTSKLKILLDTWKKFIYTVWSSNFPNHANKIIMKKFRTTTNVLTFYVVFIQKFFDSE